MDISSIIPPKKAPPPVPIEDKPEQEEAVIDAAPPRKRGGLSLQLIAAVQKIYAQGNANADNQGQPAQMGLQSGWGGKGR